MTRLAHAPAKIVRPLAAGLVRRPRLFRLLDRGTRVTWLCGPPGSGKTALATSYLEAPRRAVGRMRERGGDPEGALASYLGGLHVDDLAEGLYQGAMRCYVVLDRPAEAVALYERCRRVLGAQLGVEPSASTRAIVTSVGRAAPSRTLAT